MSRTDSIQPSPAGSPHRHLTLLDSTSIIVGIIIGSSIFRSAGLIASQVPNVGWLVGLWVIGAAFALVGALCYAELATAYPKEGGDYVFLTEAFGRKTGFLFAWAQFWIVRPGSVGTTAFVFAEYASHLCPLPDDCRPKLIYAAGSILALTGINLLGVRAGKWTQNLLTAVKYLGLLAIVAVGMTCTPAAAEPAATKPLDLGFALIFVIYAFGGWNEMPYVSAEVRDPQKNILRALVLGTLAVAAIYIAVNLAFVRALGLQGLQTSQAVAADVVGLRIGPAADRCISLLICISALGAINGMVFTGARIFYAVGTEHRLFAWLGQWSSATDAPARPLILQAAAAVSVVIGFGWGHDGLSGFEESVTFYSPTFFLFLCFVGISVFIFRSRPSASKGSYRVPLYPLVPALFFISSAYMFDKTLLYAIDKAPGGLVASAVVLAVGAVLAIVE